MHTMRRPLAVSIAAVLLTGCGARAECPTFDRGVSVGTAGASALTEASGLAASRRHVGVLWAHNDSGDSARVFALRTDGVHLGTYNLSGISAMDFEDMAVGRGPIAGVDYLYVGDIGDNGNSRPNIRVHRVAEPMVDPDGPLVTGTLTGVQTMTLVYPDGPRDAETLMVDVNRDLYIVTKRVTAVGRVYRAAYPQSTTSTITLEYVGELPWGSVSGTAGATGGDISADGSAVIVRRYSLFAPAATLWRRGVGMSIGDVFATVGCDVDMPLEVQGESVAFAPNGLGYYTLGEGASQPIWWFDGPALVRGDLDGDGDVDLADFGSFQLCFTGVGGMFGDGCGPADFDGDYDVDLADFGGFQLAFGTGVH